MMFLCACKKKEAVAAHGSKAPAISSTGGTAGCCASARSDALDPCDLEECEGRRESCPADMATANSPPLQLFMRQSQLESKTGD